jgi:hypothetical protein
MNLILPVLSPNLIRGGVMPLHLMAKVVSRGKIAS